MRRITYATIVLLILAMVMPSDLYGQRRRAPKKKKSDGTSSVISYFHLYGGGAYSSFLHGIDNIQLVKGSSLAGSPQSKVPGGGAGVIGLGYTLKHKKSPFMFKVGLEGMFSNSSTRVDAFSQSGTFQYVNPNDPTDKSNVAYNMEFSEYRESQNRFSLGMPILFGGQFKKWYFGVGVAPNLGLVGSYTVKANLTTTAKDDQLIDQFIDMPNHTFKSSEPNGKSDVDFGFDLPVRAEAGIILDDWMPESATTMTAKKKKRGRGRAKRGGGGGTKKISYRVGLWVDYGVLNVVGGDKTKGLLEFDGMDAAGTIDPEKIHNTVPNSVLENSGAEGKSVNPLVVGAKFEVLFYTVKEAPKKKRPRRTRKKPVKKALPDPPYFYGVVMDYETEQPLSADLRIYNLDDNQDTVFAAVTATETGLAETRMNSGKFGIMVKKPGYITFVDTLYQFDNDTLYIDLQPIKKNTVVILQNLHFDTDKVVIKNASTSSLEEMYELLKQNPSIKVEISGHTDSQGSAKYNKRLSEGRAKAVYDEMVRRGIKANRMTWRGAGEDEPIDTNETPEGRQENRRVEFKITSR